MPRRALPFIAYCSILRSRPCFHVAGRPGWTTNHNHADCRKLGITRSIIPRSVPPRHRGRVLFHHAPGRMRRESPRVSRAVRLVSEVPHRPPAHTSERPRPCHAAHKRGMQPTRSASRIIILMVRTAIAVLTISRPLCPHRTRACALFRQVHHQGKHGEQVRVAVPPVHTGGATICRLRFLPLSLHFSTSLSFYFSIAVSLYFCISLFF